MKYEAFVREGEGPWTRTEELVRAAAGDVRRLSYEDLETLAALQRRVVSDFAFARTHFPASAAERRLRPLAFSVHRLMGHRERPLVARIVRFYLQGYRTHFRSSLPAVLSSVAIFAGATVTGFIVTLITPDFATTFVAPETLQAVCRGEVWTDNISALIPSQVLSASIFTNNITVAIVAWAGGALLGLFTLYVLTLNGMMFGSILSLVWQYGVLDRLFAFIGAHGPLELFLITVAAAAGLEMARGQLTSENRPRKDSFARAARASVKLLAGTIPWFVLLGVVEGVISPRHDVSTAVKATLGVSLLAAFLLYVLVPVATRAREAA